MTSAMFVIWSPPSSKFSRTFMTIAFPEAPTMDILCVTQTLLSSVAPEGGSRRSFICFGTAACTRNAVSVFPRAPSYRAVNLTSCPSADRWTFSTYRRRNASS